MKDKIIEFLKPDKGKTVIALILPAIWITLRIIISKLLTPEAIVVKLHPITYVISYLFEALIFYPFACSISMLFGYYKEKKTEDLKRDRARVALLFIGIFIFNPVVLPILIFSPYILVHMFETPQGLYVIEVIPNSPASKFLNDILEPNKIIVEINNTKINSVREALEIIEKSQHGDQLRVRTSGGSSGSIHLGSHSNFTRGYLGIRVRDAQGNEAIL